MFTFVSDQNTDFLMLYSVQLENMYSYLNSSLKLSDIVRGLSCQQSYFNYRSIKKVISLRNISKVFSHFYYTLMVYVCHTCYLILVPFCFYKSYQRIIRQHLYVFIKYIPNKKTQQHILNTFQ